jgi:hypothetical protein
MQGSNKSNLKLTATHCQANNIRFFAQWLFERLRLALIL